MIKFYLLVIFLLFVKTSFAAKPDESGIGGTGSSKPEINDLIFNRPDVPETITVPIVPKIEIPNIPDVIESVPGLGSTTDITREDIVPATPQK